MGTHETHHGTHSTAPGTSPPGSRPPSPPPPLPVPVTAAGRAALDAMVTRQAQIIAYIDDFKLMMILTLAVIPLLIAFRKPPAGAASSPTPVVE